MGDFNARVGTDYMSWENIIGRHGVGSMNSNGQMLLSLCSEFDLSITNTLFQQANHLKTTWKHPRSKHYHLIDYIVVRRRDRQKVYLTRSLDVGECWSDHKIVRSSINLVPRRTVRGNRALMRRKLDVTKLKLPENKDSFQATCDTKLSALTLTNNIELAWADFRDAVYDSAKETLGYVKRKHQDWFDSNDPDISAMLDNMHTTHNSWMQDKNSVQKHQAFLAIKSQVQARLRKMKQDWWSKKAKALQEAADMHDSKSFYANLKGVFGPARSNSSPILSTSGDLLTDKNEIVKRWAEHFSAVLNQESNINNNVINNIPQQPIIQALLLKLSLCEIKKAIKQLANGKAPGVDGIPAEVFKFGSLLMINKLYKILVLIWETGEVPQQFKDASIIHLYKQKGNKRVCDNHRGISLLAVAGKILARVILNRINDHLAELVLPETQCGFRSGRGTVDMIFCLRQLQEKAKEQNKDLYIVFVDLTKAFDSVCRSALWTVLKKLGIPENMLKVIVSLHEGMKAFVKHDGTLSDNFDVENGTKQGCVLAPILFALYFSVMLMVAFQDLPTGVDLEYRCNGGLYNQQRFKARTLLSYQIVRDLLFADDCALVAHSLPDIQRIINRFSAAAKDFGLTISIKKTELVYQPAQRNSIIATPTVFVEGKPLKTVQSFNYLGSIISETAKMDNEINNRIQKASSAFGKLYHRLWNSHDVSLRVKSAVYQSVVITSLLYGAETWTLYRKHIVQMDSFHMRCLREICRTKWNDKIKNSTILSRCNMSGIETYLIKAQLRWAGHVSRMPDSRMPKQMLFGQIADAPRSVGRPLLRFKDKLKDNLKKCDLDVDTW